MTIDFRPTIPTQNRELDTGNKVSDNVRAKGSTRPESAVDSADRVSVTDQAEQLRQLEARLSDMPEVNNERVESIRQAISEGRFQVDAGKIADRLIADSQEMI